MVLYANPVTNAILLPEEDFSRRNAGGVRVYWSCVERSDVSRIRNLSFGGIFVATHKPQPVGTKAQIDFLVEEGQIKTKAVVRHVQGASGMGLEFTAIAQEDRPRLGALLARQRALSRSRPNLIA